MVLIWKKMKSIMHGEIATYERIYFMIGIVYSSKTGNTQSLANSLNFMESKYCVSVEDAKDLDDAVYVEKLNKVQSIVYRMKF